MVHSLIDNGADITHERSYMDIIGPYTNNTIYGLDKTVIYNSTSPSTNINMNQY
jgi:hypothetical protein